MMESGCEARCITQGERLHFKAYYDIQPWDESGRYFLCMETPFQERPPNAADVLTLGIVDLECSRFVPLAPTRAWNFQQGCMPHWSPAAADREVIFNDRVDGALRSIVLNIHTRERRVLPLPIQAVSPDGRYAASLNFARWAKWRPGYGYAGVSDPYEGRPEPREDSVRLMDLQTSECVALVALGDVLARTSDNDARRGHPAWFNHLMFNTDGSRLAGLVRWWRPEIVEQERRSRPGAATLVHERRHCM